MHPTSHSLLGRRVRGLLLLAALAALALPLAALPTHLAHAAPNTLNVTGAADTIADDGTCTLREAIINANTDSQSGSDDCAPGSGADEIAIPAGTYTLSIMGVREEAAATGDLDLTDSVTIVGAGSASTIIQAGTDTGSPIDRVFHVMSGVSAKFRDVTIRRGALPYTTGGRGGGIYNAGTATITSSMLSNNGAYEGGAGIYNDIDGTLTITSSTLSNNGVGAFNAGGGIYNAGTATIMSSTLSNNSIRNSGGGIYNTGTLTITSSTLANNSARVIGGGGIYNDIGGTLTLSSSTLSNNSVGTTGAAGGIYNAGTATITSSTLANNFVGAYGAAGGIYNAGIATIMSSTLANNSAGALGDGGGAIYNTNALTITSSTLANNSAPVSGGIYNWNSGTVQVKNSIIANSPSGGNCGNAGTLSSSGTNLSTDSSCLNFTSVLSTELRLGPLQDNGGPTHTHVLLPSSVAIDAAVDCTDATGAPIAQDQRGVARPQGAACDVGAVEASPPAFTGGAPANGTYGASYSYTFNTSGSPAPSFSVVGGNLPPGLSLDAATGVLSGTPTQAGSFSFTMRASNSSGSADRNVSLVIDKARLTITADSKSKVSGAANPTLTASYSGLVNGDTPASLDTPLTLMTSATVTSSPGTYPIVASGAADANYAITFVNGTLTVSARPLFRVYVPQAIWPATPDLAVTSISLSPSKTSFAAGEPVELRVTVTNQGSAPAALFWVDLSINPDRPPTAANQSWNEHCALNPCYGLAWYVTNGLAPGASVTLSSQNLPPGYSNWPGAFAAGTTDLYAYVDSYNPGVVVGTVAESDESDNQFHLSGLTVTAPNLAQARRQVATDLLARPLHLGK